MWREYYYNNSAVAFTEDNDTLSSANLQNDDGSVIGTYRGETYYNYLKNLQGSTEAIVSETGAAAAVYTYSDFGETEEVVADTIGNEICYTGAIYDKDTGLYYMNARYYDAVTGRFISQDSYRGEIEDVGTWHLYAYCVNNPINYVDLNGHWIETVLDVASIGWSLAEFTSAPSWVNGGYLLWDVGSAFLPFVPGSYTVRACKFAKKGKTVSKVSLKVANKVDDLKKGKKYLTIGKYKELRKMFRGKGIKYQCHHIIEKRLGHINLPKNQYPAIPLTDDLHRIITKRWKDALEYKKNYKDLTKKEMLNAVDEVYRDMPALKKVARDTVNKYYRKAK